MTAASRLAVCQSYNDVCWRCVALTTADPACRVLVTAGHVMFILSLLLQMPFYAMLPQIPTLHMPLHTLIELTPMPDGTMKEERFPIDIPTTQHAHADVQHSVHAATPAATSSPLSHGASAAAAAWQAPAKGGSSALPAAGDSETVAVVLADAADGLVQLPACSAASGSSADSGMTTHMAGGGRCGGGADSGHSAAGYRRQLSGSSSADSPALPAEHIPVQLVVSTAAL